MDKFGAEQVMQWRRSYDIPPPNGESLAMCAERAVKYFKEFVEPQLAAGKNVLIAAHGNSLRSIIMYLDALTSQEVRMRTLTKRRSGWGVCPLESTLGTESGSSDRRPQPLDLPPPI